MLISMGIKDNMVLVLFRRKPQLAAESPKVVFDNLEPVSLMSLDACLLKTVSRKGGKHGAI